MTRYLFHNIYGDADDLLQTLPADVEAIPFGWTRDVEAYRNLKLTELRTDVSSLPSVIWLVPETTQPDYVSPTDGSITPGAVVPEHWAELRVGDMEQPWNWAAIDALTLPQPEQSK